MATLAREYRTSRPAAPHRPRTDFLVCRFDNYPEDNAADKYGAFEPDPHGDQFPDFEYTSPA